VDALQGRGVEPSTVMRFTKAHTRTPARAAEYMAGGWAHMLDCEVNRVIDEKACGAFSTEFYPTYDFKPVRDQFQATRRASKGA
jgi:hypothetical protein